MNLDEKNVLRDKLIAAKNGAIKYDPMLVDVMHGRGHLAAQRGNDLASIEKAVREFSAVWHKAAIDALRYELANDPDRHGYAGKTVQQLQDALMQEVPEYVDLPEMKALDGTVTPARREFIRMKAPPVGRIWQGIPYCRNLPSLDNIAEALK